VIYNTSGVVKSLAKTDLIAACLSKGRGPLWVKLSRTGTLAIRPVHLQ
jgi:hypothetical protein